MIARAGQPSVHALGLALAAGALLAAATFLPLDAPPLSFFFCPFRAATGLPCLTCGCTHAFHHFVRGELAAALASNPLGALLALAGAVHVFWTLLRQCGLPWAPAAPRLEARTLRWSAAIGLALNWAFVALRSAA